MFRRMLLVLILLCPLAVGTTVAANAAEEDEAPSWRWPVLSPRVVTPYVQPAHRYAAGHRGIDIAGDGEVVLAPADGTVAFAGSVAGQGVVTIDHGDGWVSTLEPVTPEVSAGDVVRAGDEVARIAGGNTAPAGAIHLGARHDGEYVNPLLLLGGVPLAVLLPCCDPPQPPLTEFRWPESDTVPTLAPVTTLSFPASVTAPIAPDPAMVFRSPLKVTAPIAAPVIVFSWPATVTPSTSPAVTALRSPSTTTS